MKVLVINSAAPFLRGGAEELATNLVRRLNARAGVESELLRLPFKWTPSERLIEEILIHRALRLHNVDRVIALKFPAYIVPHGQKVLWLLHQFRQAYDLGDVGQGLGDACRDGVIKAAVRAADNQCFADCKALYVNSATTQARLKRYNGFHGRVLPPPLNDEELFVGGEMGDYVFAGGRIAPGKRQHLLIEAMAAAPSAPRLLIAGPADDAAYAERLRRLIDQHDLAGRVELKLGFHPRRDIAAWVNGAQACVYIPYDEDSLGYVTMEAFAAGRSVLTTSDAGGLLDMVDEETGVVVEPDVAALASGLRRLTQDPMLTRQRGAAAKAGWAARGITWSDTIEALML